MASRTTEQDRRLHILTVNVRGLKTNGEKLLNKLENSEADVVFLTETKIGKNTTDTDALKNYENDWIPFFTDCDSSSKGAAILVNKKRDFRPLDEIVDESGRYVILSCWISGTFCTFVCVYHHGEERGLFKKLSKKIKPLYTDILVVGGDFNTVLDEKNDKTSLTDIGKEKDTKSKKDNDDHIRIRKELLPFMNEHDLIDAWRKKHPNDREYTYDYLDPNTNEELHSRLDYFFINADKWGLVQDCRINQVKIADHRSVSLFLDLNHQTRELKILSCTVQNLPSDEDPDIILLAKKTFEDEDFTINLRKEEREEKTWNVLWSRQSNAAILVAKRRRDIQILFTVYKEDYVILHCIVLGRLHTFVSVCHPKGTHKNLQDMLQDIMPSYSVIKVIGGIFSISKPKNKDFIEKHEFKKCNGQLPCLINGHFSQVYEIINKEMYFSLHFPKMNPEDVVRIIQSLGQLKIHRCFSAATKK